MLAFGKAEKTQEARGGPVRTDDPKRYDALKKLLSEKVETKDNRVISSHGNPYMSVVDYGGIKVYPGSYDDFLADAAVAA